MSLPKTCLAMISGGCKPLLQFTLKIKKQLSWRFCNIFDRFKPFSEIYFHWPFQGGASFVDHLCYFCLVFLCFHARLFIDALWYPAGKGLTSLLSFVMSNCDVVTFPLVSWVRRGAWLYRFLIFALCLTTALSDNRSWTRILVFLLSGRLRQVVT